MRPAGVVSKKDMGAFTICEEAGHQCTMQRFVDPGCVAVQHPVPFHCGVQQRMDLPSECVQRSMQSLCVQLVESVHRI